MSWPFESDEPRGTPDDTGEAAAVWGPFTDSMRELVELCVQSTVDLDEVRAAHADIEAAIARLGKARIARTMGQDHPLGDEQRVWSNPVIGLRNPIAPPLKVTSHPSGTAEVDFRCGPAYEGPPGLVHGGVVSLILDQVLGHAVGAGGIPGMTGTLTLRYLQGTPLGDLRCEAWVERRDGIKTWARGTISGPDGVTVEAEGLFIVPKALR